ncbi:hypothetical protein Psch_00978 [Pelotomaculum schinkii]|uniref:DUF3307 domain-containing protein n=1 Tax=Pelotomaculum schinkii TaxID=78350 RepID=A0A4Y7REH8_9FIRM|nr:DUF3307 domain-containing protein [Pelotomaculum schinkii]TEB07425.1 hypothetical protein Psch_00978 [Pelotomaculum schinkii]
MTFLYMLFLAHVLADFLFQTDRIVEEKSQLLWKGFIKHGIALFICSFFAVHFYGLKLALYLSLLITLFHLLIDFSKNYLYSKVKKKELWFSPVIFIVDQIIHLYMVILFIELFDFNIEPNILGFYSWLFPLEIGINQKEYLLRIFPINKCLITVIAYLYITLGGAILTRMVIDWIFPKKNQGVIDGCLIIKPSNHIGKYIGIFERTIILTLVLYGSYSAVAFVLTAKSIARFNELKNKDFAEYYLIGTLVSLLIAIGGGLLLQSILPVFDYE